MDTIYWVLIIWKGRLASWACRLCSPTGPCTWFMLCCHYLALLNGFWITFHFALGPTDREAGSTERHCMQCISNIIPLNPLNDPMKESFLLFSFYNKENWGLVSLSNLVKGPTANYWQNQNFSSSLPAFKAQVLAYHFIWMKGPQLNRKNSQRLGEDAESECC